MHSFYRIAWNVLFTLFYPFITLFSVLFIGLVNVISWISRLFATPHAEPEVEATPFTDWTPFVTLGGTSISRKAVHEVQFGPLVYRLRATPAVAAIQEGHWGDFAVPLAKGVLLQRWPSIAEHELDRFELIYYNAESGQLHLLRDMPSFYWEAQPQADGSVRISWNDGVESYTVTPAMLP